MTLIQILLVLVFVVAIIKVVGRWRARDLTSGGLVLWLVFWVAAIFVAINPNSTYYLSNLLGIGRGADLVVYASLILIFFLLFKMMVKIEKINKEITVLTRKDALNDKK